MQSPEGITQLLLLWNSGDQTALDKLAPLVQRELRRLAGELSPPRAIRSYAAADGPG